MPAQIKIHGCAIKTGWVARFRDGRGIQAFLQMLVPTGPSEVTIDSESAIWHMEAIVTTAPFRHILRQLDRNHRDHQKRRGNLQFCQVLKPFGLWGSAGNLCF